MDKKVMGKIEDGFCEVLKKFAETGLRSSQDVETAKAALSGMVKMKMLEEMENFHKEDGYSGRMYRDNGYSGRMYRDEGMMSRGDYRDGGYSGRMYRDDGNSYDNMHHVTRKITSMLEQMYEQAEGPQEKKEIQMWLNRLDSQH